MSSDPIEVLREVVDFLCGVGELDGRNFGDDPPYDVAGRKQPYWWREHLRQATAPFLASLSAPKPLTEQGRLVFEWRGDAVYVGTTDGQMGGLIYTADDGFWQRVLFHAATMPAPKPESAETVGLIDLLNRVATHVRHDNKLWQEVMAAIIQLGITAPPRPEASALPERDPGKPNTEQGLYRKFDVRRTDGSDQPGGKHYGCDYFVLDVTHDPLAKPALAAYATAAEGTHPQLAADMRERYGLQQASAPVGVERVDGWQHLAADWLEQQAEEQEATNAEYPKHAAAYSEWRDRPVFLRTLAEKVKKAEGSIKRHCAPPSWMFPDDPLALTQQPAAVDEAMERVRLGSPRLWHADLVGGQISVERMREILTAALAGQQPAAVDDKENRDTWRALWLVLRQTGTVAVPRCDIVSADWSRCQVEQTEHEMTGTVRLRATLLDAQPAAVDGARRVIHELCDCPNGRAEHAGDCAALEQEGGNG